MGKILLFISIAISLATAGLGVINKNKLGAKTDELQTLEQTSGQTQAAMQTVEANLKTAEEELSKATAEKEQALDQARSAQSTAEEAKNKVAEIESQIAQKDGEISKLESDIQAKETELAQLRDAAAPQDAGPTPEVSAALQEKETLINELQTKLENARAEVSTMRERETNRQQLKMRDGLQGRILAVNNAWNFVVLNLGDKNGVVSNAEMLVKRGNSLIGKVRITSVEPATSIADIVVSSVPQGVSISPGDNVIFQAVGEE
jgi:predicted RNase H-like nuclease (RuvC/YqgF family)